MPASRRVPRKRKTKAKRSSRKPVRSKKSKKTAALSTMEIKQVHCEKDTFQLSTFDGAEHLGPSNSKVLIPLLFGAAPNFAGLRQGTDSVNQCVGNWITMAYPTSLKAVISYKYLTAVDVNGTETLVVPNVRLIAGMVKVTGSQANCNTALIGTWRDNILAVAKAKLFDAGFDSDFCSYTTKSKDVLVTENRLINPDMKHISNSTRIAGGDAASLVPAKQIALSMMKRDQKIKLTKLDDGYMVPHDSWIPFAMFMVPNLGTAVGGNLQIQYISRSYFRDN